MRVFFLSVIFPPSLCCIDSLPLPLCCNLHPPAATSVVYCILRLLTPLFLPCTLQLRRSIVPSSSLMSLHHKTEHSRTIPSWFFLLYQFHIILPKYCTYRESLLLQKRSISDPYTTRTIYNGKSGMVSSYSSTQDC
mgnify:CR=1 FL=1